MSRVTGCIAASTRDGQSPQRAELSSPPSLSPRVHLMVFAWSATFHAFRQALLVRHASKRTLLLPQCFQREYRNASNPAEARFN
ncbi:hypothetical protein PhaeoP14_02321 [Phaeobacter piscinae]|nr:hypothetical protein PhaeoP14_02321 [Phaeobacter piscinae]